MSDKPEFPPELVERCAAALFEMDAPIAYRTRTKPKPTPSIVIDVYGPKAIAVLRESGRTGLVEALYWILSANAGVTDADYRVHAMQFARDALREAGAAP